MLSKLFTCGVSFTVNHLAGIVAPVNKTTTYTTVTGIPGEPSKCWITSNLGSDRQATAVTDGAESAAGWYWQFNRKQGYKHDGTTRTPATAWITGIDETSNWLYSNDPCNLELGGAWRLPTSTEWNNVDNSGGWGNSTNSWNSALKLHQAGRLMNTTGALDNRGLYGNYWSNTHNTTILGSAMTTNASYCYNQNISKSYGIGVRCIRDSCQMVTFSDAGPDQLNIVGVAANLQGNTPVNGSGQWSIVSGTGGSIATPSSPNSAFTGVLGNTYTLRWTISTNCLTSADDVVIYFWDCGYNAVANHITGNVAPVTKSVNYGTVKNIQGEPSKCWITGNLGASQQATGVNDATEASAGWHWQFNKKQGYKHDGTTRTPNTTWITSIIENSDWQTVNDPCNLELGSSWHIPTYTEWYNVDNAGSWSTWAGPYNSALHIHAAGELVAGGSLAARGVYGRYWSSSQNNSTTANFLRFESSSCQMYTEPKTYGWSIRCLKPMNIPTVTTSSVGSVTNSSAIAGGSVTNNGGTMVTARGVVWSLTTGPTIALSTKTTDGAGTGAFTSNISGLTPSTTYYLRAYATNVVGTAYGNEVTFTTSAFTCGTSSVTAYHLAGSVAPVSKTVTYGTVGNIPGETSKCWITRNLGASQQATAVADATEASAGWYWQFNKKQGYNHDGTTRTPNTTWITSISENADWQTINDPCNLELGSSWRIPTYTEWFNVDNVGNWSTWTGPYNSGLYIHAAGELVSGGSLGGRGSVGRYWSSNQYNLTAAHFLRIESSGSFMLTEPKTYGWSLRCLRPLANP
jgi:hypothetical protein